MEPWIFSEAWSVVSLVMFNLRLAAIVIVVISAPHCRAADIIYSDFSSTAGLTLNGAAGTVGNALRLTPDSPYQAGSAWYTDQQEIASGFVTTFQFQLTHPSDLYADGIWFGVQNDSLNPGPAPSDAFAVEFDTFQNTWDPNGNHVAFMSCGPAPDTTVNNACLLAINPNLPIVLSDGLVHTASISYLPGSMTLSLDGSNVLTSAIDLSTILNLNGGNAWVGFYTTTGDYSENNDILSWQFATVPEPGSGPLLAIILALLVCSQYAMHRHRADTSFRSDGPST
jgi:hypothetical protein